MGYFIGSIFVLLAFVFLKRFIKNPNPIQSAGRTPTYQYMLYGLFGFGFGIVGAGVIAAVLVNENYSNFANMKSLFRLLMIVGPIVGIGIGLLLAYIFPSKLVVPPSTAEKIMEIEKAQENPTIPSPKQYALIQGTGFITIGLLLLWAGYSSNFNMTDYAGITYAPWYLIAVPCLVIAIGIYRIIYYLVIKIKEIL